MKTACLLDLYPIRGGFRLWFTDGECRAFSLDFPSFTEMFVSGPDGKLRKAESRLSRSSLPVRTEMTSRRELFSDREIPVMRVEVGDPLLHHTRAVRLLSEIQELELWNADIGSEVQFMLRTGLFPLAPCAIEEDAAVKSLSVVPLEDPWEAGYSPPPLRTARIMAGNEGRPFSCLELESTDEHIAIETPARARWWRGSTPSCCAATRT